MPTWSAADYAAYWDYMSAILGLALTIIALVVLFGLAQLAYHACLAPFRHVSGLPRGSAALVTCKLFGGGHCTTRGELVDGLCLNHQAKLEPVLCPRPTCGRPRRAGGILCEPCSKLKSFDADRAPVDVMGSPLDWILEGEARAEAEWKREGGAGHDAH